MLCILVVSPDSALISRLQRLLCDELSGYDLHTARDASDAADIAWQVTVDAVLADLDAAGDAQVQGVRETVEGLRTLLPEARLIALARSTALARPVLSEGWADDFFVLDARYTWEEEKLPACIFDLVGHWATRSPASLAVAQALRSAGDAEVLWLFGPEGSGRAHLADVMRRGGPRRRGPQETVYLSAPAWEHLDQALSGPPGQVRVRQADLLGELSLTEQTELLRRLRAAAQANWRVAFAANRPPHDLSPAPMPELVDWICGGALVQVPDLAQRRKDFPEVLDVHRRMMVARETTAVRTVSAEGADQLWEVFAQQNGQMRGAMQQAEQILQSVPGSALGRGELALLRHGDYSCLRGGQHGGRERLSGPDLVRLTGDGRLVLLADGDRRRPCVTAVWVDGAPREVDDARVGRILWLLASDPGREVDLGEHRHDIGLHPKEQFKHHILRARKLLDDRVLEGRKGLYISARYGGVYSFADDQSFWLCWPEARVGDEHNGTEPAGD